jgi:hypothetical protein
LALGSLYLGFVPVAIMLIQFVQVYKQQELMFLGLEVVKLLLNVWLAFVSGSKVSTYRQLINSSFMQKDQKYF